MNYCKRRCDYFRWLMRLWWAFKCRQNCNFRNLSSWIVYMIDIASSQFKNFFCLITSDESSIYIQKILQSCVLILTETLIFEQISINSCIEIYERSMQMKETFAMKIYIVIYIKVNWKMILQRKDDGLRDCQSANEKILNNYNEGKNWNNWQLRWTIFFLSWTFDLRYKLKLFIDFSISNVLKWVRMRD